MTKGLLLITKCAGGAVGYTPFDGICTICYDAVKTANGETEDISRYLQSTNSY